ncbi:MAG: DUF3429 domain-containing protein [Alphaproteobacteria bacterium]|nr:DUF3429 domain-containing protein [Alphaproteobacteria bacterium SS10]
MSMSGTEATTPIVEPTRQVPGDQIPLPAAVLGYGGLTPFVLSALGIWLLPVSIATFVVSAQIFYAAIIIGFLGAVHWGWAIMKDFDAPTTSWEPYAWGVTPAILAWVIVVLSAWPTSTAPGDTMLALDQTVSLMMALLLLTLLIDLKHSRTPDAGAPPRWPAWFRRLRWHLTIGAVASLAISLIRILSYDAP